MHDSNRPVVAALTLGCKLNQAETQSAARQLQRQGCVTTDRPAPAHAYLINTCTITHVADRKARRLIRLARKLSPDAPVIVTGCYAERGGAALTQLGNELGNVQIVGNLRKGEAASALLDALGALDALDHAPNAGARPRPTQTGRTRAFLKIQEGCDDVCAFCIVPYVRGRERAVPIAEIVSMARERVAEGVQEIVLTGTQPGAYGRDRTDGASAAALVNALLAQTDAPRIRYSSIQPQDITPELLACWDDARLCRHFHLALQSGSDLVLDRMRRRYRSERFVQAVADIRAAVSGASITTDIIAGFPGETADDHRATLAVMDTVRFTDVHVFPYSQRPHTSASLLDDNVPPAVKRERAAELRTLGQRHRADALAGQVGEVHSVLFEGSDRGLTDTYLPCRVDDSRDLTNQLRSVAIESVADDALVGRVLA